MWSVKCEVWSVKEAVRSEKCEVWSVECEVWSVKFQFGVRRAQCEVWSVRFGVWRKQWEVRSVKCGVWSVECGVWSFSLECEERSVKCEVWSCEVWSMKEAVRSEKCEVWSVECEVWSLECEECSVKCGVWSVKTLLRLSLKKSNGCRGKDTVGTGCLWTIGHLCLGNFRRRLARGLCYPKISWLLIVLTLLKWHFNPFYGYHVSGINLYLTQSRHLSSHVIPPMSSPCWAAKKHAVGHRPARAWLWKGFKMFQGRHQGPEMMDPTHGTYQLEGIMYVYCICIYI